MFNENEIELVSAAEVSALFNSTSGWSELAKKEINALLYDPIYVREHTLGEFRITVCGPANKADLKALEGALRVGGYSDINFDVNPNGSVKINFSVDYETP